MAVTQPADAASDDLQQLDRDTQYYAAHRAELLRRYPNMWVAIYNQHVVGAAQEAEQLLTELEVRGVAVERALIQRVSDEEDLLILIGGSR
jgi:hypothetical protein